MRFRGSGFGLRFLFARHHRTAACCAAGAVGLGHGYDTTGVLTPLSRPYMCFPLFAGKCLSAASLLAILHSCPPRDTPVSWAVTGGCHPGLEA